MRDVLCTTLRSDNHTHTHVERKILVPGTFVLMYIQHTSVVRRVPSKGTVLLTYTLVVTYVNCTGTVAERKSHLKGQTKDAKVS